ncbi:FkbM family methyltransferase [Sporomusa malonica]|uniref:Methyltransferase, FkbM family n=1 Tax=Sporomusa malonica TaxID=112901 RepID=A0A1W2EVC7_9FIRM|nr:FkbM family methyltransferase [Sporomusa malonica]SMD13532.1 methyltransferase, FkbM family [Sporomusa malonica]
MQRFYSQFIKKGTLVFDVGANIGNRTETFLNLGATVIAIEPQPYCADILIQKYSSNENFTIVQKALGNCAGKSKMWINSAHVISSLSEEWIKRTTSTNRFGTGQQYYTSCNVEVTTLDNLIQQFGKPDFCKIDVEGFEFEVLQGLSQPIKTLSFEYTREYSEASENCINHLVNMGNYRFNYSSGESMRLKLRNWVDAQTICNCIKSFSGLEWGDIYACYKGEDSNERT